MRALIVYESMYGNTHTVAEAIARGIAPTGVVTTIPVSEVSQEDISAYDLLIVGGPTHVHGMSRESTRRGAVEAAEKPESNLTLEPDAASAGIREWLDALDRSEGTAAAFDTRVDKPAVLTGRASKGISKRLRHLGFTLAADPESFLVDTQTQLLEGEEARAEQWGEMLAQKTSART